MSSSTIYHARSISLPSRPHPVAEQLEEQLSRLRSSLSTSTSSSSISNDLSSLTDLYSCVDDLLQLSLNQQNAKWVDEVLDGSLRLLEICGASRDALQQSRERLQDLQFSLRRRCNGELTIISETAEYLNTRRTVRKSIKKCLKNLKSAAEQKDEADATLNLVKDVEATTSYTLKCLLNFIAGSQKSRWSVVTKLINKNTNKSEAAMNEFDEVDETLNSLMSQTKKRMSLSQIDNLTSQILKLEAEIEDLDEALDSLFRPS